LTVTGVGTTCGTLALAAGTTSTAEVTVESVILTLSAEEVELLFDLVFCSVEVFFSSVFVETDFVVLASVHAVDPSVRASAADNFAAALDFSFPFSATWLKRKSTKLRPEFADEDEVVPEEFPAASPATVLVDAVT
jgi:hypothetical protein